MPTDKPIPLDVNCSLNGRRPPQRNILDNVPLDRSASPTSSLLVTSGHLTFAMNQLPMSYTVLCTDVDRNLHAGVSMPLLGVCQSTLSITETPPDWESFPRFVLNTYYTLPSGVWVNILIDAEIVVCVYVKVLKNIQTFAKALCTVCAFPVCQCQCGTRSRPNNRSWELATTRGVPITQSSDFSARLRRNERNFTLSCNFDDPYFEEIIDDTRSVKAVFQTAVTRLPESSFGSFLVDPKENQPYLKLFEDLVTLWFQWKRSRSLAESLMAVSACVRSVTGRSVIYMSKDCMEYISGLLSGLFVFQSTTFSGVASKVYNDYRSCRKSVIARKLHQVFTHVVAQCVFHKLGCGYDRKLVEGMEQPALEAIEKKSLSKVSFSKKLEFADAAVELIAFLATHGYQAIKLGSIEPLLISSHTLAQWHEKGRQLVTDAEHLGNPDAAGFSLLDYLRRLDVAIMEGESICKLTEADTFEKRMVLSLKNQLTVLRRDYLTLTAAQALRHQPFGVVLYGTPRIGKSSVLEAMSHAHAIRNGLDPSPGHRFQHNANEEYWTNFRSWQHTIVLDDVACHVPNKMQGIDPTIAELIKVVNNQPYCPAQAAIDDKGKTPVLAKLVFATTNVRDMNLETYFADRMAPMMRMRFHVTVTVKDEYCVPGTQEIDSSRIPDELYPDCWNFQVTPPTPNGYVEDKAYGNTLRFTSMRDFLDHFLKVSSLHHTNQKKFLASSQKYA